MPILQPHLLPGIEAMANGLPGTRPLDPAEWLVIDDAFAAQMAERDRLVATRRDEVIALLPGAEAAAEELLDTVLAALSPAYDVAPMQVARPDGVAVPLDRADLMGTLARLTAEDHCLMQKRGDEHVLTAAALCFPSRWMLAQKIGRPLVRIHRPVDRYDDDVARRVQRLFDGVRPGRPLVRANLVRHTDPALFQPVPEDVKDRADRASAPYLRSERQVILRLPASGAVVFSIHTTLVAAAK